MPAAGLRDGLLQQQLHPHREITNIVRVVHAEFDNLEAVILECLVESFRPKISEVYLTAKLERSERAAFRSAKPAPD